LQDQRFRLNSPGNDQTTRIHHDPLLTGTRQAPPTDCEDPWRLITNAASAALQGSTVQSRPND
ncbi:MAG: hypothetical protein WAU35_13825, partial [Azonexus sp.]